MTLEQVRDVGEGLPATLLFDQPNVADLTAYLARTVFADLGCDGDSGGADRDTAAEDRRERLRRMTDEEATALLMQQLDRLGKETTP